MNQITDMIRSHGKGQAMSNDKADVKWTGKKCIHFKNKKLIRIVSLIHSEYADFKADAEYALSKRNIRNLIEPGTAYEYSKGELNRTANAMFDPK